MSVVSFFVVALRKVCSNGLFLLPSLMLLSSFNFLVVDTGMLITQLPGTVGKLCRNVMMNFVI